MANATAEKAQEFAGQAQEKAGEAAEQARGQVRTQVDERSTQAGEQVSTHASNIRTVAQTLREQGQDKPAELAEQAADRAEKLGSYLTDSDADRILHDVEDFARRQPWAVAFGGLLAGFAASRLLKASSTERYQTRSTSGPSWDTGRTQQIQPAPRADTARFDRDLPAGPGEFA
ncbi:MAG: hypothetical protein ACJ762_04025 [Solirubrobacteraceae bacterium]